MTATAGCHVCQQVFASAPEDEYFVPYICEHAPDCCCEPELVSSHADTPVMDEEVLIRLVIDDTHVKRAEDGTVELKSTFLSDLVSFGSSTLRLGRATVGEFEHQIDTLLAAGKFKADGSPREVIGYVAIPVNIVRALTAKVKKDEKGNEPLVRSCAAYATGLEGVPNHADMMLNAVHRFSNGGRISAMKAVGNAVRDNFTVVNSVEEILALGI